MKIYVAGKFEKKEEILRIYEELKKLGHEISYDWTKHKSIKPYEQNQGLANEYSENELQGLMNCDIFIYLTSDKGHTLHMEFGCCLVLNKINNKPIIYAVGEDKDKSPWMFNKRIKRRNSVKEVIEEIKNM